jgi:amino acid transporter
LTFNNYQSELTYLFFIAAISFVIIATLFLRYRDQLREELLKLTFRERVAMIGVYLTGFSVFFFFLSSGISLIGIPLSLVGLGILVWVYARRRKPRAN